MYSSFDDARELNNKRILNAGALFSVVIGLLLLVATVLTHTHVAESTSLVGLSSSSSLARHQTLASLPGPRAWKDVAIAAIKASNGCNRGVSVKRHAELEEAVAGMDDASKAELEGATTKATLKMQDLAGILPPTGFFDPAGFSTDLSPGKLLFYREVEIKHGRVCMLASLGFLVAEQFHPFFGGGIDVPSYVAFQETPLNEFWIAVAFVVGIPELTSTESFKSPGDATFEMKEDRIPGDLGFDPLGLKPKDPKELLDLQNKELSNGRLAMLATAGMIAQELVSGKKLF